MFGVPVNANLVYVPLVQTGCCKSEFDSTYPIHLNGIISQDEYRESIENINRATSSKKGMLICGILSALCMIGGMVFFIVGAVTLKNFRSYSFPVLFDVGMGVFILGTITMSVGCCIIQIRRSTRIREAISKESMKYSTRSPTPCSWRLNIERIYRSAYHNRRNATLLYQLAIEIGNSVPGGYPSAPYRSNQVGPQPSSSSFFPSNSNNYPPPPYDQSSGRFCSQCGLPRQNSNAKFCSSCGQPFNKY
ncbi:unnamed protein product [Rotaria sordida]|uniref:Uncharacterized protein n=1 Tax=Rotaria sordida TaxID=392033 RepID=A0A819LBI9_9BILA|nr:unnamed protein product [Rotaria sordida]CAF3959414.1 unnamed protein product [Rotaria sordida]